MCDVVNGEFFLSKVFLAVQHAFEKYIKCYCSGCKGLKVFDILKGELFLVKLLLAPRYAFEECIKCY